MSRRAAGWPVQGAVWLLASPISAVFGVAILVGTIYAATSFKNPTEGLTWVVLVLTALLVLTEPRRRLAHRDLFWRYMADAEYEALHNLQHIAKAYRDDESLKGWPQFYVLAARRLIDPPFNDYMLRTEPSLWPHLDHMVRNEDYLRRYPFTVGAANEAKDILGYFVEHCLRFVIAAGRASESKVGPHTAAVIEKVGVGKLAELAFSNTDPVHVRMTKDVADKDIKRGQATSVVREYGLIGDETAVYWFGCENDPYALWHAFRALDDPPPRKEFTASVIRV